MRRLSMPRLQLAVFVGRSTFQKLRLNLPAQKACVILASSSNVHMLSLRSATSSLLARSFATAAPKFDASKLNSFIKGNDAR
jgi:hypothetical protein